jgi:hypothetical protein
VTTSTLFGLTEIGACEHVACHNPVYRELAKCTDPDCFHNLHCAECVELYEDVAEELLQGELEDLFDAVAQGISWESEDDIGGADV